jgi:thiamine transporter ThiT
LQEGPFLFAVGAFVVLLIDVFVDFLVDFLAIGGFGAKFAQKSETFAIDEFSADVD